jgi:MinD-like ATPase involved in chromosome partitioning or flagellar assembly
VLIALISPKGAPGVTTAALVLAAMTERSLMVEFDPSGGSIETWVESPSEPGLLRVANALRRSMDADAVRIGARSAPTGLAVVHAPASGPMTESSIAAIGERLPIAMDGASETVILDCGRWSRTQATSARLVGVDAIVIVCTPTVPGLSAAIPLIESVEAATTIRPLILLVGDRPYSAAEVEAAASTTVVGVLPWDSRSVNALLAGGVTKSWMRSPLARAGAAAMSRLRATAETGDASRGAVA